MFQWLFLSHFIDAAQSTCVTLPPDYLVHPIGYLILQYHALFALERNELTVLRVLLKTAAAAVQHQSRANRSASKVTPNKVASSPPSSSTAIPTQPSSSFSAPAAPSALCFRWRPEVLQVCPVYATLTIIVDGAAFRYP